MLDEREKPPLGDGGLSGMSSAGCLDSEIKATRQNTQIKFQDPAEFDAEIALALTASGWRATAALLTHAANCVEAGDFLNAETNRRQAREQFNTATDVFRQFQEVRAAAAGWIGAEAFLGAPQ